MRLLAALVVAASFLVTPNAENIATCGTAAYFPSEYVCYNDTALCPTVYGLPTVPCSGSGGCYAPQALSCNMGTLGTLPKASSPFTLTAFGTRETYRNVPVKACGNYLAIGANARECTSCTGAGPGIQCSSYKGKTVLLPDGSMAADVPGGQYWYVNPRDGILQFTKAANVAPGVNSTTGWNATAQTLEIPGKEFAGQRVTVYENGFFEYDSPSHYWLACLRTLPGGNIGTGRSWRIYSSSPSNVEFKDCEKIKLIATAVDKKQGAYRYE
ncbi:hypothetical protein B0T25DRAFT_589166 [Lasiosphaeria hispida]|uniref:Endo-1,3(4)-beta-glucanase 1 carbohydrate binding domain-containing protein n=1 Tax=Lasiosphaeria hispida TaxID=260671 RepID=A0AAJ0HL44_9PEZI|nr:hypothetical protein B0T25DRAFT_589166 [Lasiosphaeria hispida]